jgi:hypothetical protein
MSDDDKSVVSKLVDKFSEVVESISASASKAAQDTTEASAKKIEPGPDRVARTANEQIYIPEATDAAAMPLPLMGPPKVARKKSGPSMSGRITPTYDIPLPDTPLPAAKKKTKGSKKAAAKKGAEKPAKNSPKTRAAKKNQSAAGRKAVGKKKSPKRFSKKKKAKRG